MQIHIVLTVPPTPKELAFAETFINVLRGSASPAPMAVPLAAATSALPVPLPPPVPAGVADPTVFQREVEPPAASIIAQAPAHDSRGFPWDERIHSGNKTLNQDGSWKKRKNVPDATVASMEHELHVAGRTVGGQGSTPQAPAMPSAPATPPVPPVPAAPTSDGQSFPELMKRFANGVRDKKFPPTVANEMAQAVGVASAIGINQNVALLPKAFAYIEARETGVDHATASAMVAHL